MSTAEDYRSLGPLLSSNRTHQLNEIDCRRPANENRKSNKPLLEKKRRARINRSLDQLKNLLMNVIKNDTATSYSKLEKADILEMTVKHLRQIQTQQKTASALDTRVHHRYQTGFSECAHEVNRYLLSIEGLQPEVRLRLMNHLAESISTPQTIHCSSADRITALTSLRISPPPTPFSDMRCVIERLPPVTCSNVTRPLTSQMSPVAVEQLRLGEVTGMVTSSYDVTRLSEGVNRVIAHAHRRRNDPSVEEEEMRRSSMGEEVSLGDSEVLSVRGKGRPMGDRNNNDICLNSTISSTVSNSSSNAHQFDDEDGKEEEIHLRPSMDKLLRREHFDEMDVKEEDKVCWRPW